jgi:hypothetical protein
VPGSPDFPALISVAQGDNSIGAGVVQMLVPFGFAAALIFGAYLAARSRSSSRRSAKSTDGSVKSAPAGLEDAYETAWKEWQESGDAQAWSSATADGLGSEAD